MVTSATLQGDNMPVLYLQLVPLPQSGKKSLNAALNHQLMCRKVRLNSESTDLCLVVYMKEKSSIMYVKQWLWKCVVF